MTERETLLVLLKGAETKVAEMLSSPLSLDEWLGVYADRLLANGVIVPPCKVGDTVYIVDGTTDGIVEGNITNFEYNIYTTPQEWITVVGNYPFVGELREKNRIDLLIGKTVFLTKEDAEKALKERSELK